MLRAGIERDDRLARVHRDAELQPFALGPVAHGECSADGALGVVAVRDGRTEHAHDSVSDELLDAAAEALELAPHALVVGDEEGANVFGVELLGSGCEADEIDEEDGDEASLLAGPSRLGERCAARVAELRPVGVLLAASRAREHGVED